MALSPPVLRRPSLAGLLALLLALLFNVGPVQGLAPGLAAPSAGAGAGPWPAERPGVSRSIYRCDGDPLAADLVRGSVDDPTIPDPSRGPVLVGGFVVLHWRTFTLQLPRTNNAGAASFSDGRWWWSLERPNHPRFRLRRAAGDVQDFACEPG